MRDLSSRTLILTALILGVALAAWAAPQQPQSQGKQEGKEKKAAGKPAESAEPAPLFEGKLNLKSSRKTKDTAVMGFNGIDPSGKVEKQFLSSSAGGDAQAKAAQLAGYRVDQQELAAFLAEGNLNGGGQ